jgi:polysaccharide pyruvyl transferase WcaK-like protein
MPRQSFYSIGLFGGGNFGDELLSRCVTNRLRETYPDGIIYMMTQNPQGSEKYTGAKAKYVKGHWPEPEYYLHLWQHLCAVAKSRVVVISGGGLLADYYSWTSIPLHCIDLLWAILMGQRYVYVGVGVRNIRRRWLRQLARFVCIHAVALYCRDAESAAIVRELTGRDDIKTGPDLANMERNKFKNKFEEQNYALVNLREYPRIDKEKVIALCNELLKKVKILVLFPSEIGDIDYCERIVTWLGPAQQAATKIAKSNSLNEAIQWIQEAKFIVAERLHVNICAAHAAKRLLTVNYEGKVERFIDALEDKPLTCSLKDVGAEQAKKLLEIEPKDWFKKLTEMEKQAKELFDETVKRGLSSASYTFKERFSAAVYLAILLVIGALWASAVLVKRAIFGRRTLLRSRWS